jgi:hypothetical protein
MGLYHTYGLCKNRVLLGINFIYVFFCLHNGGHNRDNRQSLWLLSGIIIAAINGSDVP